MHFPPEGFGSVAAFPQDFALEPPRRFAPTLLGQEGSRA
jgi:hypothetical protein